MNVEELNTVADKVVQLNKEYNSRLRSPDLQLLRPYLQMMESLTVLNTIDKNSQPFALSLVISSIGILKSSSELGIVGPTIEKIVNKLVDAANATQPDQSVGNKKLFKDGVLLVLGGVMALSAFAANEGLVANGLFSEDTQNEADAFGLELLVHLVIYSQALHYVFETLTEVCNYKHKEDITHFLTLIALLMSVWVVSRNKGPQLEEIMQSLRPKIKEYLTKVGKTTGNSDFDESRKLIVILSQASFALDQQDNQKFIEALNAALNICDVNQEDLGRDIDDICSQIKTLTSLLKDGGDDELNLKTSYWQAG